MIPTSYDGLSVNGLTVMLPDVPDGEAADLAGEVREVLEELFARCGETESLWLSSVLVVRDGRFAMPSTEELEQFDTVFVYERGGGVLSGHIEDHD